MATKQLSPIEQKLIAPMLETSNRYWAFVLSMSAIVIFGLTAWIYQLMNGLEVTGLSHRVFWGIYIANFIFFIGISYSGTLISAILRITHAEWRTPLTRMAEEITLVGIIIGFMNVLIDMGRPDRVFLVPYASRLQSPLFWDMLSLSTYLAGSMLFFYLPLIPDMARLRDYFADLEGYRMRKTVYRVLAIGWRGTEKQKKALERSMHYVAIIIIPVAIMCHTVIAFIFATTARVGWHSTIFGPYFVVAAIFSGTGAIVVMMAVLREIYGLQEYITYRHFRNMGYVLFTLLGGYMYFTLSEYFTAFYRGSEEDVQLMSQMFWGRYQWYFWFFMVFGMIIPGLIIFYYSYNYKSERAVWAIAFSGVLVVIGMWVKRYIIIVPALTRPFVSEQWSVYHPSWVEWAVTAACSAGVLLAIAIFAKLVPMISLWELEEEEERLKELEEANKAKYTSPS